MLGIILTLALAVCGFMKWLRSDRTVQVLLVLSAAVAAVGLVGRVPGNPRLNSWDGLLGPFIYVASYGLLRRWYKRTYHREPTYNRHSWYDAEEGRRQNWLDVGVHILPMMAGLLIPLVLTRLLG